MRVAAVDIGTNSIRLLVVDDRVGELTRLAIVTGLGRGVDATGRLDEESMTRTLAVLAGYRQQMKVLGVERAKAVATSASRDASNRQEFFARAAAVLGMSPVLISGAEEAALSYAGATEGLEEGDYVVVDIGGGSTELVWKTSSRVVGHSVDIGSVRLTERALTRRPAAFDEVERAAALVAELLRTVSEPPAGSQVVGVAGTWTSLAAIALSLPAYNRELVHHSKLDGPTLETLVGRLASMTVAETAAIPALDPARAPVMLGGAVVARECLRFLDADEAMVSESDLLDGVVLELLTD